MKTEISKYLAEIGRKGGSIGGKTTGPTKARDMKKAWITRRKNAKKNARLRKSLQHKEI